MLDFDNEYSVEEMEKKLQEVQKEMTENEIITSEAYAKYLVNEIAPDSVEMTEFERKLAERHEKEIKGVLEEFINFQK